MKLDVITPSHINLDQVVMGYCVLEKLRILMVEMRGFFEIFFLKNNLVFWSKIFMIWLKMDVTSLNQSIFCRNSKVLLTCIVKLMLPGFPGIFSGNPGISRSREENISGRNANPSLDFLDKNPDCVTVCTVSLWQVFLWLLVQCLLSFVHFYHHLLQINNKGILQRRATLKFSARHITHGKLSFRTRLRMCVSSRE